MSCPRQKPTGVIYAWHKKAIIQVEYHEFEDFVKEKYPELSEYEFPCVQEANNDSSYTFTVYNDKRELRDYESKQWQEFLLKKGTKPYMNHLLFKKLYLDGYIEPGEYLIHVSW